MLDLTGDAPRIVDQVETGRLYLDGSVLIGSMDGVARDRIRMALNGHVTVTLIIDENDEPLGDAWCELRGGYRHATSPLATSLPPSASRRPARCRGA